MAHGSRTLEARDYEAGVRLACRIRATASEGLPLAGNENGTAVRTAVFPDILTGWPAYNPGLRGYPGVVRHRVAYSARDCSALWKCPSAQIGCVNRKFLSG